MGNPNDPKQRDADKKTGRPVQQGQDQSGQGQQGGMDKRPGQQSGQDDKGRQQGGGADPSQTKDDDDEGEGSETPTKPA